MVLQTRNLLLVPKTRDEVLAQVAAMPADGLKIDRA
jgi:hypothetical protein